MASLYEQMDNLLTPDSFKEGLAKSAEENKDMNLSDTFSFDRFKKEALPQFREKDEIIEKATATGTGLLTGTLGIPSDIVSLASAGADLADKYIDNSTVTVMKDFLNRAEQEIGRPAFDKKFTEITGLESNPANVDQLIGEIISPTGAFLVPLKTLNKLFTPIKKGMSEFFNNIPTSGGSLKSANNAPIQTAKKDDAIAPNQPIINLSEIGEKTRAGRDAKDAYLKLEDNIFKMRGQNYSELNYKNLPSSVKDDLYKQTGVYRGKEGKFRFKISTGEAQFNQGGLKQVGIIEGGGNIVPRFNASKIPSEGIALEEMLNFKDLYKQYLTKNSNFFDGVKGVENPAQFDLLKNIKVKSMDDIIKLLKSEGATTAEVDKFRETTSAVYSVRGSRETIYVSSNDLSKVRSDLLHEVQHAIQRREGFAPGGNTQAILNKNTNGSFQLDVQKLEDDQKQILDDFFKDYPNADELVKERFQSATDKLVQREFKYMYKDGLDLKNTKDFLPNNAGTYRVNIRDDFNNVSYNGDNLKFTEQEADMINTLTDNSSFREYMKLRALTERQTIRLQKLEDAAVIEYRNLGGEVQARRTETMDALYKQKVKELREQGYLKPNQAVSPELQERIFRAVGLNVNKANPKYLDMLPSKFEGQGVLQGQDIKPQGTNVDTYANIKEQ